MEPPDLNVKALRAALLAWYHRNARDLPWRRTRAPYAIWVSEIMLQQTRVDTVIPFYERFMERWPTVNDLAQANPEEVRAMWSGLGYYQRAQNMLKASQVIVEQHQGKVPSNINQLAELPGFGPYTRGAVASIAFDKEVAAVDGNVMRVLSRIGAFEGDVRQSTNSKKIWTLAEALSKGESPGYFNQSLIELGALICKKAPLCAECPARPYCKAYQHNLTDKIPAPKKKSPPKIEHWTACVLYNDVSVVLQSQPLSGRFGGMWCPILFKQKLDVEVAHTELKKLGFSGLTLEIRSPITHILTHRRLETTVYIARITSKELTYQEESLNMIHLSSLNTLGLPSFSVKLLRAGIPPDLIPKNMPGRFKKLGNSQPSLPFTSEQ